MKRGDREEPVGELDQADAVKTENRKASIICLNTETRKVTMTLMIKRRMLTSEIMVMTLMSMFFVKVVKLEKKKI